MRVLRLLLPTVVFGWLVAIALAAELRTIEGRVVGITDGDTITVLNDSKKQYTIRLEGIDAPESHQAFGTQSRKALSEKIFGKRVRVEWKELDKYGRTLGHIYLDDRHINLELLEEGWAWHYKNYNKSEELAKAETKARNAKAGLWRDEIPIPPWEFRHPTAAASPTPAKATPASNSARGPPDTKEQVVIVYVTKTGQKYHVAGCRHLSKSSIAVPLSEAKAKYGPCSNCNPPK